jgi:hypothetical protein
MSETQQSKSGIPPSYSKFQEQLSAYRDAIVKNTRVYTQGTSAFSFNIKNAPLINGDIEERSEHIDEYIEDPEIQRLRAIMVKRSPQNLSWCSVNDNTVLISKIILVHSILGSSGLEVKTKNEEDKEWIEDYLKLIKYKKIIRDSIEDNVPFADSIYSKEYRKGVGIIPHWIEYLTLHRIHNPYIDRTKWIQVTYTDANMPTTERAWKSYVPTLDQFHDTPQFDFVPKTKYHTAQLLDEDAIRIQLFAVPPIRTIVEVIIWKKWMQHDALLGGQKYATPLLDITVTLPDDMELTKQETWDLMDQISGDFNTMMNFGNIAHPDSVKVTTVQQNGQVFNFTTYLEYADKQIHKTILVPAGLVDSKGTELATGKTLNDRFSVNVGSLRDIYVEIFESITKENAEFVGRKLDDFKLAFSEEDKQQRLTHMEEITALFGMYDRGMFKDENEFRMYVSKFDMELEQLSPAELDMIKAIEQRIMAQKPEQDNHTRKTASGKMVSVSGSNRTTSIKNIQNPPK